MKRKPLTGLVVTLRPDHEDDRVFIDTPAGRVTVGVVRIAGNKARVQINTPERWRITRPSHYWEGQHVTA